MSLEIGKRAVISILMSGVVLCGAACGGGSPMPITATKGAPAVNEANVTPAADDPTGPITRASIESLPKWVAARADSETEPDAAASKALRDVPPGATVRVFLGTWCGDSRREVTRFFKASDLAAGPWPFTVELIAVDHAKTAPGGLTDGVGLRYVPTFVVVRDGKEVGRIIESSPAGIEKDLRSLLRGERSGIISGRTDVGA